MDHLQVVKDLVRDWISDDVIFSPSIPLKTYQNKKRNTKVSLDSKEKNKFKNDILNKPSTTQEKISGRLMCGICEFKTASPRFMNAHMRKHTRKKNVICDRCFRRFSSSEHLANHIRIVHRRVDYKCIVCEYKTNEYRSLRRHFLGHKNVNLEQNNLKKNYDEQLSDCTVCSYKFESKTYLKRHMKLHYGNSSFFCLVCNNTFKKPDDMKRINDTTSGLMQFQCKCEFKYTLKNPVRGKLILSDGERPFECNICSCKFRHPHVLTSHLKSHSERSAYRCQLCTNTFRLRAHLESHMKSHTQHTALTSPGSNETN